MSRGWVESESWKAWAAPANLPRTLAGSAMRRPGVLDRDHRVAERHVGGQVEGDGHGREEPLVVHLQGRCGRLEAGQRGERHRRAGLRAHVDRRERLRTLPELGRQLHHHVVLVERGVDRRDLALPERAVQRLVDEPGAHSDPGRGVPVDGERHLQARVLLVARDVAQLGQRAERLEHARGPLAQILKTVGLQRVLVLGIADPSAQPDVLHRLEIEGGPRHPRELRPEPCDHLVGGGVPLPARLERDEHARGIDGGAAATAPAGIGGHGGDRRIGLHDRGELGYLLAHGLEGDVLGSHHPSR